ncbi:cation:proton antiporter [Gudongella sp. SC589]|jgi:CPA2 family monovalent cation:H+ antiporter-2|uniref:cation:proton antiporter n=1 Tax=Gudongella sp. SC589 TaxID=3385990 RepID=UPI0039047FED
MSIYGQVAIAFVSLALFGRIAEKTESFYPPFYILAGILMGPPILNIVVDHEVIGLFSEIGVVFLLFYLGFEFSLQTLLERKKTLIIAGMIDFFFNFSIGFLLGQLIGLDIFYSFVIAGIIYMSSSGIITKTLIQLNSVKDPEGELVMGIMIFEDLVMVIYLVLISAMANQANGFNMISLGIDLGMAIIFCVLLVFIGVKFHTQIDWFIHSTSKEIMLLNFLGLVFAVTYIGIQLGVSEALGAFFLGVAVSQGKSREKVERTALKFRDIFGSIFFFYFGMQLNLQGLGNYVGWVTIAIIFASLGKLLGGQLIRKALGCSKNKGVFIGLVTVSRGEFSLLISGIVGSQVFPFQSFSVILILGTAFISTIGFRVLEYLCTRNKMCLLEKKPMD